ncbi:MAG: hypothetical protein KatS3mg103_0733 [Phycisphaerales bacterium]|nr:MAG: hypothetical protein KatS3mg103_0733 [Phycisphaerales bacterium]
MVTHAWIARVSAVGFFPAMLLQGAWTGLFVLLACWALRRVCAGGRKGAGGAAGGSVLAEALVLALAWSVVEVLRGSVLFGGYAWLLVGHPMIEAPWLRLGGAVVGAYGVGLLVAASAGALAGLVHRPARWARALLAAVVPMGVLAALGVLAPAVGTARDDAVRVGIVQTNVPQDNRMAWGLEDQLAHFERFERLTESLRGRADVVVWPETMLPGPPIGPQAVEQMRRFGLVYRLDLPDRPTLPATWFVDRLLALQARLGVPMLVGATAVEGLALSVGPDGSVRQEQQGLYNSVHAVVDGRLLETRYDKLRLTIFGEVLPLASRWPWLERRLLALGAQGMRFDLDAGRAPVWFELPVGSGDSAGASGTLRLATPICFEVSFAGLCRKLALGGGRRVDALANLTNDGWFAGSDAGRALHLKLARWRALENGVPVLRSANTGISAIIDARGGLAPLQIELPEGPAGGHVRTAGRRLPTRAWAVLIGPVPPRTVAATPYARAGYLTPWAIVLAAAFVVVAGGRPGRLGK